MLSITEKSVHDIEDHFLKFKIAGLEFCPIIFTANNLELVNPVLVDRCKVVHVKAPDAQRVQEIIKDYAAEKLEEKYYRSCVDLDMKLLEKNICELLSRKQSSLRMFHQMVDNVLQCAHNEAMKRDEDDVVFVTQEMFSLVLDKLADKRERRVGF